MALLNLYRAEQARAIDRVAIEQAGIPGILLMKRAAFSAFEQLQNRWPEARRICVVCGVGNNGGDGFALAQYATLAGLQVDVLQVGPTHKIRGDALTMLHEMADLGLSGLPFDTDTLNSTDVIVDALLGTGLDRCVEGAYRDAIAAINASGKPVLALDIPSGLSADTGQALGTAVRADATVTFIVPKLGLFMEQGRALAGEVICADLGVPDDVLATQTPAVQGLHWADCPRPPRPAHAHKGRCGTALLIGGDTLAGAIALASEAALHSGAGLTQVVTRTEHRTTLLCRNPALMVYDQLTPERLEAATAVGIGPGLGRDDWGRSLLQPLLHRDLPRVLDADALNVLADTPMRADNWILTPHPGEAARLLGCSVAEVQTDRLSAVHKLQQRYGGVIVLKGAGTLIDDGSRIYLCLQGNPGMATGGMGDVLTGIVTALLAQGLPLADAARSGVCLHAAAADLAAAHHGQRGLEPTQLFAPLQHLLG